MADEEDTPDGQGPIPQSLLKKYIVYAKQNVKPRLANVDTDKLTKVYAELRRESEAGGGMPLAVRHIESMIRMSEASARMHLRQNVRESDLDFGIRVMLESFISSQKFGVQRSLEKKFKKYLNHNKDNDELLFFLLQNLFRDETQYSRSKNFLRLSQDQDEPVRVPVSHPPSPPSPPSPPLPLSSLSPSPPSPVSPPRQPASASPCSTPALDNSPSCALALESDPHARSQSSRFLSRKSQVRDLEQRAKELDIHDLSAFFDSGIFGQSFALDASKTTITRL